MFKGPMSVYKCQHINGIDLGVNTVSTPALMLFVILGKIFSLNLNDLCFHPAFRFYDFMKMCTSSCFLL